MKYYIAYKFLGADKGLLKKKLETISQTLEGLGHTTFVFLRDNLNWGAKVLTNKDIIQTALSELELADVFLALVENEQKSEGMLLEAGYAKALNKKIILLIKKGIDLRFLRSIADIVIEFKDIEELNDLLSKKM